MDVAGNDKGVRSPVFQLIIASGIKSIGEAVVEKPCNFFVLNSFSCILDSFL